AGHRNGAFRHSVEEKPVGTVRPRQSDDPLSGCAVEDQRVDLPRANGLEGGEGVLQLGSERVEFSVTSGPWERGRHDDGSTATISSPTSTRSVSERSPMILRMGGGSFRTRVGSATMSSVRAN